LVSALSTANRVSITFVTQKTGQKLDTVTQWRTDDNILCPVIHWEAIIKQISRYKGASKPTPVSVNWSTNRISHITSKIMENALRDAVVGIGEEKLCIKNTKLECTPCDRDQ
jgi:hypothetical protein